jgi:hypothetical protein
MTNKIKFASKDYYAKAVLKFAKLNTAAQQRGAFVQGRSLPPIPASVSLGERRNFYKLMLLKFIARTV